MPEETFTVIDGGRAVEVRARVVAGTVRLAPESVKAALGWEVGPEGLCRDLACVPVPPGSVLANHDGVDLVTLAEILDRPLALDREERAAYLGVSADDRGRALAALEAPDFVLPDLDGRLHLLSEHRGKKVLLVAYASW